MQTLSCCSRRRCAEAGTNESARSIASLITPPSRAGCMGTAIAFRLWLRTKRLAENRDSMNSSKAPRPRYLDESLCVMNDCAGRGGNPRRIICRSKEQSRREERVDGRLKERWRDVQFFRSAAAAFLKKTISSNETRKPRCLVLERLPVLLECLLVSRFVFHQGSRSGLFVLSIRRRGSSRVRVRSLISIGWSCLNRKEISP